MLRKLIRNRFPIPSQNRWESEEQAGFWSRRGAGEAEEGFAPLLFTSHGRGYVGGGVENKVS